MIQVVAVLVVLLSVPLLGGTIERLGEVRIKAAWCAPAAIGVQLLLTQAELPLLGTNVGNILHLASYGLAVWFVVANRRVRGLWILALGGLANLAAISANGGVMPASDAAARTAGITTEATRFQNSKVVTDARLSILGDIFAIPESLPLANVFSIGDVLLVVGLAYVLHAGSGSRPFRTARAEAPEVGDSMLYVERTNDGPLDSLVEAKASAPAGPPVSDTSTTSRVVGPPARPPT